MAATYTYDPYGNITTKTGTNAADNLIEYTGQLADTGTGAATLYTHDGNRWYSPNTGNFTTQDTSNYLDDPQTATATLTPATTPPTTSTPPECSAEFWELSPVLLPFSRQSAVSAGLVGSVGCGIGFIVALAPGCGVGGAIGTFAGFWIGVGWESAAEIEGK